MLRPVTVQAVETVEQVNAPGAEVTVYPLMEAPPLEAGAVQDTTDWALAYEVPVTAVGAPGCVAGVAGAEAADAGPAPAALAAVTVNVYGVPLVRPLTRQVVATLEQENPPGEEVTVYPVMAAPPLLTGAVQATVDLALAFEVADTAVGAPGTAAGTAGADAADEGPVPAELVAETVKV